MQHHPHWRCLVLGKHVVILNINACHSTAPGCPKKGCDFLMDENWKKESFHCFFALLGCGFNDHLSFSDIPMKPLFSFYVSQQPSFLGFKTVKLIWLIHLFYLHSVEAIYTVQGAPRVTHGETERECETSTDTVPPEIGDTYWALLRHDAQVDTCAFAWLKPRLGSYSQGARGPKGRTLAPRAGRWPLASWPHWPVFLKFTVLGAIP